jgi:hypothetical protein
LRKASSILTEYNSRNKPKDVGADAEIFISSEFDDGGYFVPTDASGKEHWCYVFLGSDAEEGYQSPHFVLHTACLTILQYALEDSHPSFPIRCLDDFYEALCAQSGAGGLVGMPLKNGHYGAEQSWAQDWEAKKGWEVR